MEFFARVSRKYGVWEGVELRVHVRAVMDADVRACATLLASEGAHRRACTHMHILYTFGCAACRM